MVISFTLIWWISVICSRSFRVSSCDDAGVPVAAFSIVVAVATVANAHECCFCCC